jgi:hypothetical protein
MTATPEAAAAHHEKQNLFFVDTKEYKTELLNLTGAQIRAIVGTIEQSYSLFLEEPGDKPDLLITDSYTVSLEKDHGPRRFYTVPPASFGR